MPKTVEEYIELIQEIRVRGIGAAQPETLVNGEGDIHEVPGVSWIVFSWVANKIGFGESTFRFHDDGRIECDDETMGANFIEALLVKLARTAKMRGK